MITLLTKKFESEEKFVSKKIGDIPGYDYAVFDSDTLIYFLKKNESDSINFSYLKSLNELVFFSIYHSDHVKLEFDQN